MMSGDLRRRRLLKWFLVTIDMKVQDQLEGTVWVRRGSLCLEQDNGSNQEEYQWVKVVDNGSVLKLEKKFLLKVNSDHGGLLEPVDPDVRIKLLNNPETLNQLATLPLGSHLWVEMGSPDKLAEALLKYVGPVSGGSSAVYFGVQLKGSAKGKGVSNGSYNGRRFFMADENCAMFVPVSQIKKRQWSSSGRNSTESHDQTRVKIQRNVSGRSNGPSNRRNNGHEKTSCRITLRQPRLSPPQNILPRAAESAPIAAHVQGHVRGAPPPPLPMKMGQRVDIQHVPFHVGQRVNVPIEDVVRSGEVRFCGPLPGRSSQTVYVGIQLDEPVGQWDGYCNNQKLCNISTVPFGALQPASKVSAAVVSEPKSKLVTSTQAIKSFLKNGLPHVHKPATSPITSPVTTAPPAPPAAASRVPLLPPNKNKIPPLPPPKPAQWFNPPPAPPPKPQSPTSYQKELEQPYSPTNGVHSPLSPTQRPPDSPEEVDGSNNVDVESGQGRRRLELGSMVEVNDPPLFGVIRWIGRISGVQETVAGIELEQELSAGTDGSYLGERYFHCSANKGLFVKLRKCRRDSRFPEPEAPVNQVERCNSIAFAEWGSERVEDHTPPIEGDEARELYQGWKRGIQGHFNSCYLDATLFSLFSCCSSADWVLFWPSDPETDQSRAQDLVRCEIVNPLRRFGYVCASKTMALRRLLEAAHRDAGFTNQEKDPEEFLNKLFQLLTVEPLLKIRSMSQQPQECHLYQLFPPTLPSSPSDGPHSQPNSPIALLSPPSGHMRVASVQSLLESSFYHSGLKFVEAPSCLLLLMPRFGKDFKMYDAILPSLSIDITDLLDDALRQCSICESVAEWECVQCYDDPDITPGQLKQYCQTCNTQVHSHKKRVSHSPVKIGVPQGSITGPLHGTRQRMSLFAVTCIETSHYVSFVKHGPAPTDWLFFDSMADREGGENGFNVPRVRACPEVGRYLSLSQEDLGRVDPASLKETARRLLCDAHMCLYHSPELSLYK